MILIALVLWGCDAPPETAPDGGTAAPADTNPSLLRLSPEAVANAGLELTAAGPAQVSLALRLNGEVQLIPERLAVVSAGVKGVVKQADKKLGDKVKRGEILALIDSRELTEAKVAYFESEHKQDFTRKALERERALVEKGLAPREELQKREHEAEEAVMAHAAALQRLKLLGFSEERLHELQEDLKSDMTRFTLRSPFAGEILRKQVTLGETVEGERELYAVADFSRVMIEAKVPMEQVGALKPGLKVKAECEKIQAAADGEVTFVSPVADPGTRTVAVRAEIPNPEGLWKPGMPARLLLDAAPQSLAVAVPRTAIQEAGGKSLVFVEREPTLFEARVIQLGAGDERVVEVKDGLRTGERVVSSNALLLRTEWQNRGGR